MAFSSRSKVRFTTIMMIIASVAVMGACRAFVDLDGLGPGSDNGVAPDGSLADGGTDSNSNSGDSGSNIVNDGSSIVDTGVRDVELPPADGGCVRLGGPVPVRIDAGPITMCVDSTEVTVGQYKTFLASNPSVANASAVCKWKTNFVPGGGWPVANDALPVTDVDWCDAVTFCEWSGKHLCGAIGGGPINQASVGSTTTSEWMFACTGGGQTLYPYGNTYDPVACNGTDLQAGKPLPVATLPKCQGGFAGVYDMSGNLHEWINSCSDFLDAGAQDTPCVINDNAFSHSSSDMACSRLYVDLGRATRLDELGIRCCSP